MSRIGPPSAAPLGAAHALVVLALFVAGVAYYGVTLWQVWSTGHHDQARDVDAIVVMGAANYDGRPSPLLKARLDHALALYEEGLAPTIVVTGGKLEGDRFTEAEASRRYLVNQGVPDDAILSEDEGRSTWESLEGVAVLLGDKDIERVLIVTDPFHALRSRLIAQELGLTAYTSPTDSSPWGCGTQFKKSLKEAAGIAVGRDHRLPSPVERHGVTATIVALHGEWCNWQHSRFWFCYSGFDSLLPSSGRVGAGTRSRR